MRVCECLAADINSLHKLQFIIVVGVVAVAPFIAICSNRQLTAPHNKCIDVDVLVVSVVLPRNYHQRKHHGNERIAVCVCMCVCLLNIINNSIHQSRWAPLATVHTHTHTYTQVVWLALHFISIDFEHLLCDAAIRLYTFVCTKVLRYIVRAHTSNSITHILAFMRHNHHRAWSELTSSLSCVRETQSAWQLSCRVVFGLPLAHHHHYQPHSSSATACCCFGSYLHAGSGSSGKTASLAKKVGI